VAVFNHYCSKGHFEGVTLATEKTPWWWSIWRAKQVRNLLTSAVHVMLVI